MKMSGSGKIIIGVAADYVEAILSGSGRIELNGSSANFEAVLSGSGSIKAKELKTEEGEFSEIYNLQVLDIPTNLKIARIDSDDEIYKTNQERDEAVIDLIENCQKNKQPVLVGTVSIEKSEI